MGWSWRAGGHDTRALKFGSTHGPLRLRGALRTPRRVLRPRSSRVRRLGRWTAQAGRRQAPRGSPAKARRGLPRRRLRDGAGDRATGEGRGAEGHGGGDRPQPKDAGTSSQEETREPHLYGDGGGEDGL